jgi:hypothetical protein
LGADHTLELVLADINEARRVDDAGGEVVDHLEGVDRFSLVFKYK